MAGQKGIQLQLSNAVSSWVTWGWTMANSATSALRRDMYHAGYRCLVNHVEPLQDTKVTVTFKQLRNGDHIIVPRRFSNPEDIPDEVPQNAYRYYHHGILIKKGPNPKDAYVIAFTAPEEQNTGGQDEPDGALFDQVRTVAADALLTTINRLAVAPATRNNLVRKERLSEFTVKIDDKPEPEDRYIRFSTHAVDGKALQSGDHAAEIAEFFLQHPNSLGTYDLLSFNCETFASMCRTITCTVQELKDDFLPLQDERARQEFLCSKKRSTVTTENKERFYAHLFRSLLIIPTYECSTSEEEEMEEVEG